MKTNDTNNHCPKCNTALSLVPGVGLYCPNQSCDVFDNINNWDQPKKRLFEKLTYTTTVQEIGPDNELYIQLPVEMLAQLQWAIDDELVWSDNYNGSFTITRRK